MSITSRKVKKATNTVVDVVFEEKKPRGRPRSRAVKATATTEQDIMNYINEVQQKVENETLKQKLEIAEFNLKEEKDRRKLLEARRDKFRERFESSQSLLQHERKRHAMIASVLLNQIADGTLSVVAGPRDR